MTESSGFFTTTPETFYTEEQYNRYNNALKTNGVIAADLTNDGFDAAGMLSVGEYIIPNMLITVNTGHCLIQGYWGYNSSFVDQTIAPNTSGNPRIDRVVERLDKTANTVSLAVITGTPGVSPTPPALTRTPTVWEISLAQVEVINGASTITNSDITDERADPAVCGYATAAYYINEDLNMRGHKAVNLAEPTAAQDAATKSYVDGAMTGFSVSDLLVDADKDWNDKAITNLKSTTVNSLKLTASDTLRYSDDTDARHNGPTFKVLKSVIVPTDYTQRQRLSTVRVKFTLTLAHGSGAATAYVYIPSAGKMGIIRETTAIEEVEYSEDFSGLAGGDAIMIVGAYTSGSDNFRVRNFRVYGTDSGVTEVMGSSGTPSWT